MALHVVLQRSLVPGLPLPPNEAQTFIARLEGGLAQSKDNHQTSIVNFDGNKDDHRPSSTSSFVDDGISYNREHLSPTPPKSLPLKTLHQQMSWNVSAPPNHTATNASASGVMSRISAGEKEVEKENSSNSAPAKVSSPTSPEWNEANLTKILGLSPMGYA